MDFSNGDSFEKHTPDLSYIHALTLKSEKHESWLLNSFVGELLWENQNQQKHYLQTWK